MKKFVVCRYCGMECLDDGGVLRIIEYSRDQEFCDEAPTRVGGLIGLHEEEK